LRLVDRGDCGGEVGAHASVGSGSDLVYRKTSLLIAYVHADRHYVHTVIS
jgi:hypothetical protein